VDGLIDPHNAGCECGGCLKWQRLIDDGCERWLGICLDCGGMRAFLPDDPGRLVDDPLTAFLGHADPSPSRPPWVRAFRASAGWPWHARWSHRRQPCVRCSAPTVLTLEHPPADFTGVRGALCLACGEVRAAYLKGGFAAGGWLAGHEWAPPCPAVIRLRRALFAPFPQPYIAGRLYGEEDESR
jgi:hypothetical protein